MNNKLLNIAEHQDESENLFINSFAHKEINIFIDSDKGSSDRGSKNQNYRNKNRNNGSSSSYEDSIDRYLGFK